MNQNVPIQERLHSETVFTAPSEFDVPSEMQSTAVSGGSAITRFPDGTAIVGPAEDERAHFPDRMQHGDHDENLALVLSDSELSDIGHSLKNSIEDDISSQEPFIEAVGTIIKQLGLSLPSESDEDSLPFKGASAVYSSALFESALDIVASAKQSIFKSSGMVDTVVVGDESEQLQDIAFRKKSFFNYFFDVVAKEFRKEAIRTIFWAALTGSAYKKVYICPVLGRPVSNFIPIADFIVNRDHSSHMVATRKTHILRNLSEKEYQIRVMMGMYRDINIMKQEDSDSSDVITDELHSMSGYAPARSSYDDAGYTIYECHTDYRIKGDPEGNQYDIPLPYIISLDEKSGKVLSIRRNWDKPNGQEIPLKTKKEYFVNYSLLPSLDGEGYGLLNYAGNLAEAATSLKRQLINSGIYANFPGGVYASGMRIDKNNIRPAPGEFIPLATGGIPISQALQALPYKEPSAALNELKNDIEDSIRKPTAIVNQKVSEMAPRAPVGSTLAMLENLHKVPNAIMQNFYESFTRELELYNDRMAEWLPNDRPYPFMVPGGQHVIMKNDFQAGVNVLPSCDPTTKNSTHRFMLSEIIINNAKETPNIHNLDYAYRYFYKNLGISDDDVKQLLTPKKDDPTPPPPPLDPVSTIMAITKGEPVQAAVWQNHDAYLAIIDTWMQANPQNSHLPIANSLKQQHEAFKYMVDVYAKLNMAPPEDPSQLNPEQQNQLAVEIAHIKLQEAQEAQSGITPPEPPLDPARVELEAVNIQGQIAREKNELEFKRIEVSIQRLEMEHALKVQEFELKNHEFELKNQIEHLKQDVAAKKAEIDAFKVSHEQAMKEHELELKERDLMMQEYRNHDVVNDVGQEGAHI